LRSSDEGDRRGGMDRSTATMGLDGREEKLTVGSIGIAVVASRG